MAAVAIIGCANPAGAQFSAKRQVIAILGGELYVGVAEGYLDGSGTLAIHSQTVANVTCAGEFTSSKELGGAGQLRCSDGAISIFSFQRINAFKGHGGGSFSRGTMSFTYGLTAEESVAHLAAPLGKKLALQGEVLALVDSQ